MRELQQVLGQAVSGLVGRELVSIERGLGSFVMLDFAEIPEGATRSEWHIWIYQTHWRLEEGSRLVVGSGDTEATIDGVLPSLDRAQLADIDVTDDGLNIRFEDGRVLRTVTTAAEGEDDEWMLFTPIGTVLSVRSGGRWQYESTGEGT